MKKMLIMLVLTITALSFAELKLAYVNSDKIMAEYQEVTKVRTDLDKFKKEKEGELLKKETEIKKLEEEIKNMPVMISEDKKKEKLAEGQRKMEEYYALRERLVGQNGELFREQQRLMEPIMKKINDAIKALSEEDKYDFVFDANTGALLYGKPTYDVTDKVLKILNK